MAASNINQLTLECFQEGYYYYYWEIMLLKPARASQVAFTSMSVQTRNVVKTLKEVNKRYYVIYCHV